MSKSVKKALELVCVFAFLLAIIGCENADGTPNLAWIIPMLSVSGITGFILIENDNQNQ